MSVDGLVTIDIKAAPNQLLQLFARRAVHEEPSLVGWFSRVVPQRTHFRGAKGDYGATLLSKNARMAAVVAPDCSSIGMWPALSIMAKVALGMIAAMASALTGAMI